MAGRRISRPDIMDSAEPAAVQRLFGLRVRSSQPIPYTTVLPPSDSPPEVVVHCGVMPCWLETISRTAFYRDESLPYERLTIDRFANGAFLCDYPDGTSLVVAPSDIRMSWRR